MAPKTPWASPHGPTTLKPRPARNCASRLVHATRNRSIVVVTRYTGRASYDIQLPWADGIDGQDKDNHHHGALGTQADIVIFSLVRNNEERNVGAAGTLQDVNVAISRSKEKLIILGNFNTMLNGWSAVPNSSNRLRYGFKSSSRVLARLVVQKYGKVIDAPQTLTR